MKSPSAVTVPLQCPFSGVLFHHGKGECTRLFHLFRSYLRMVNGQNNVCSCFSSTMADVLPQCYKSFPFSHCRKSFLLAAWIVKVCFAGHQSKYEWCIFPTHYAFISLWWVKQISKSWFSTLFCVFSSWMLQWWMKSSELAQIESLMIFLNGGHFDGISSHTLISLQLNMSWLFWFMSVFVPVW